MTNEEWNILYKGRRVPYNPIVLSATDANYIEMSNEDIVRIVDPHNTYGSNFDAFRPYTDLSLTYIAKDSTYSSYTEMSATSYRAYPTITLNSFNFRQEEVSKELVGFRVVVDVNKIMPYPLSVRFEITMDGTVINDSIIELSKETDTLYVSQLVSVDSSGDSYVLFAELEYPDHPYHGVNSGTLTITSEQLKGYVYLLAFQPATNSLLPSDDNVSSETDILLYREDLDTSAVTFDELYVETINENYPHSDKPSIKIYQGSDRSIEGALGDDPKTPNYFKFNSGIYTAKRQSDYKAEYGIYGKITQTGALLYNKDNKGISETVHEAIIPYRQQGLFTSIDTTYFVTMTEPDDVYVFIFVRFDVAPTNIDIPDTQALIYQNRLSGGTRSYVKLPTMVTELQHMRGGKGIRVIARVTGHENDGDFKVFIDYPYENNTTAVVRPYPDTADDMEQPVFHTIINKDLKTEVADSLTIPMTLTFVTESQFIFNAGTDALDGVLLDFYYGHNYTAVGETTYSTSAGLLLDANNEITLDLAHSTGFFHIGVVKASSGADFWTDSSPTAGFTGQLEIGIPVPDFTELSQAEGSKSDLIAAWSAITGYEVEVLISTDQENWSEISDSPASSSGSVRITGLAFDVEYFCKMRFKSAGILGSWSIVLSETPVEEETSGSLKLLSEMTYVVNNDLGDSPFPHGNSDLVINSFIDFYDEYQSKFLDGSFKVVGSMCGYMLGVYDAPSIRDIDLHATQEAQNLIKPYLDKYYYSDDITVGFKNHAMFDMFISTIGMGDIVTQFTYEDDILFGKSVKRLSRDSYVLATIAFLENTYKSIDSYTGNKRIKIIRFLKHKINSAILVQKKLDVSNVYRDRVLNLAENINALSIKANNKL
jgi:hypothetical protein